jgi:ketosteroid isomerase-like protein
MSQENVETVERALDLFASEGPRAGFDAGLLAEDAEWRPVIELTGNQTFVGADGFETFLSEWTQEFDDWGLETLALIDGGDVVVAYQRQRAHGKRSGTFVEQNFAAVFRLSGGIITQLETYLSKEEALQAAGLSE